MRGKEKTASFLIIAALFVAALIGAVFFPNDPGYSFPQVPDSIDTPTTDLSSKRITAGDDYEMDRWSTGSTNYADKELLVDDTFTTNLPLVIIDTGDENPKRGVTWNNEKQYYVSTGEDPYAYGDIVVINNQGGQNTPLDQPESQSECKVKIRGNSSGNYDKKQYLIKLLNEKGKPNNEDILGMGDDSEWVMNVSFVDKSLLRNYLAYVTAGEVMPYTPDVRYCELIWKRGDEYQYLGVYLMMESVKVGDNRVDLPSYSENGSTVPALLRRDRYSEESIMLEDYASVNGLEDQDIRIEYPEADVITQKGIDSITNRINHFEEALYSDSWDEFVKYRDYIDMQSFADYFIINEFFINYDAGAHSTNIYMDYSGKISMGPVWDFDQGIDNSVDYPAYYQSTAVDTAPWFDQIFKDPLFTDAVIKRYAELRETILSDDAIRDFVEKTVDYLGPAIERDWARWHYFYVDSDPLAIDPDGTNRNTKTYDAEVECILNALSEHGAWMDEHLNTLYRHELISPDEARAELDEGVKDYRPALAAIFVFVVLLSVALVLKGEQE